MLRILIISFVLCIPFLLHLGTRNVATIQVRSADELRLEVLAAARDRECNSDYRSSLFLE